MYYCTDCKIFIEDPKQKNFKINGRTERRAVCPVCGENLVLLKPEYCRYCGARLKDAAGDGYCGDECRRLGKKLWTRELRRRRRIKADPIARILRMLTDYNREHKTKYSYGQFVALVLPKLEACRRKAYGC